MFHIYLIVGPTGKVYVGLSKNVKERWRSHKARAFKEGKKHPLYDAMRKYGHEAFFVTLLESHDLLPDAQSAEIVAIKELRSDDRSRGYNLSPGGEYDALIGPKIFWDRMRSDPEAYEVYRQNLSAAQQRRSREIDGHEIAESLLRFNRALSARERYKRAYRALRINGTRIKPMAAGRLRPHGPRSAAKLASITNRKNVIEVWAGREDTERRAIFDKISETLRAKYREDPEFKESQQESIANARLHIDKEKQGKAASGGLKKFWADLKADPERYARYISSRKATLMKTLEAKKNEG